MERYKNVSLKLTGSTTVYKYEKHKNGITGWDSKTWKYHYQNLSTLFFYFNKISLITRHVMKEHVVMRN